MISGFILFAHKIFDNLGRREFPEIEFNVQLPDAVTRAAGDLGDGDVRGPLDNSNAIIAGRNGAARDVDAVRTAQMDSVRVWAISRSRYVEVDAGEVT